MNGFVSPQLKHDTSYDMDAQKLLKGEILLETQPYSDWGGAVTARMYLPLERSHVWQQVTDYSRWVHYFPALSRSEVLRGDSSKGAKRLYQVASKAFLMFTAQVEIYLKVFEIMHQNSGHQIQFRLERGSFTDFSANLNLQDFKTGTLLTYSVQATPTVLVPSWLIQEAMRLDLPSNLQKMRHVLCGYFC